jgi:hypothetical protein
VNDFAFNMPAVPGFVERMGKLLGVKFEFVAEEPEELFGNPSPASVVFNNSSDDVRAMFGLPPPGNTPACAGKTS